MIKKCEMALEITDSNIGEVLNSELVVIDFWAAWCGPCRMVGPVIDELANDNPDIMVGKINVDENPVSATNYGIRSIPAILFIKNGVVVDRLLGANPKSAYQNKINALK